MRRAFSSLVVAPNGAMENSVEEQPPSEPRASASGGRARKKGPAPLKMTRQKCDVHFHPLLWPGTRPWKTPLKNTLQWRATTALTFADQSARKARREVESFTGV